jgi:LmbE family N-acetylglucosaminyl deacetylase
MRVPRRIVRAIAAAKPLVPKSAWPIALSARSALGVGPLIALPRADRALVLAPHPDDETLGCGGTIAALARRGTSLTIVMVTNGEATRGSSAPPGEVAAQRTLEVINACRVLGAPAPQFLSLPDGEVHAHVHQLARRLVDIIDAVEPDIVFLPWFGDGHRDHQALDAAFVQAVGERKFLFEVWGYETWTPLPPTRLVDITSHLDTKRAAMAQHRVAKQAFDIEAVLGLNRYRSLYGLMGHGYAEAFIAAPLPQYLKMRSEALAP